MAALCVMLKSQMYWFHVTNYSVMHSMEVTIHKL